MNLAHHLKSLFKIKLKFKVILALLWAVFTFTLIGWWMVYLSSQTDLQVQNHKKMFLWEGSILLIAVGLGGLFLIVLTIRDEARFNRLRLFFSTFSHDIKTSISRLRLQADVLEEEMGENKKIKRLIHDIHRLDLQLENSLWMANLSEISFFIENISLVEFISSLRSEFVDLHIEISRNAMVCADRRAFISVIRNVLQNAQIHGQATMIKIEVESAESNMVNIRVCDNGKGMENLSALLGQEILNTTSKNSNGIGLFLSCFLITKQNGTIAFSNITHPTIYGGSNNGFCVTIKMLGHLIDGVGALG
jgi:signal transduction histidine kinase